MCIDMTGVLRRGVGLRGLTGGANGTLSDSGGRTMGMPIGAVVAGIERGVAERGGTPGADECSTGVGWLAV